MAPANGTPPSAQPLSAPTTLWGQLVLVCVTQFMGWAGFGAILPYLPIFLKEQGHARVWMIGVVASAYYVGTFVFSSPLGRLSDLVGRKPVILSGVTLYAVATGLFLTTTDPWWFVLFRLLEGAGAAASGPAGNAFVADITSEESRSSAFGWLTTSQFGGLVAGPLVGSVIMALAGGGRAGFEAIFLVGCVTMTATGIALALFLHEPEHAVRRRREKVERPSYRSLASAPIVAFIVVAFASHFAMGGWEVLWSVWLRHLGASMSYIGWTWAAFSLPMLLSFAGGYIADRGNRFLLMFSGYTISAFCWIAYSSNQQPHAVHHPERGRGVRHRLVLPGQTGVPGAVQPAPLAGHHPGHGADLDAARRPYRHPDRAAHLRGDLGVRDRRRRRGRADRVGHRRAGPRRRVEAHHRLGRGAERQGGREAGGGRAGESARRRPVQGVATGERYFSLSYAR